MRRFSWKVGGAEVKRRADKFTELVTCLSATNKRGQHVGAFAEDSDACGHMVCADCWEGWFRAELEKVIDKLFALTVEVTFIEPPL